MNLKILATVSCASYRNVWRVDIVSLTGRSRLTVERCRHTNKVIYKTLCSSISSSTENDTQSDMYISIDIVTSILHIYILLFCQLKTIFRQILEKAEVYYSSSRVLRKLNKPLKHCRILHTIHETCCVNRQLSWVLIGLKLNKLVINARLVKVV